MSEGICKVYGWGVFDNSFLYVIMEMCEEGSLELWRTVRMFGKKRDNTKKQNSNNSDKNDHGDDNDNSSSDNGCKSNSDCRR